MKEDKKQHLQKDPKTGNYTYVPSKEKKSTKLFGIRQLVNNREKVEQFFIELCKDVPVDGQDLEKRKHEFSKREKVGTIINRELLAVSVGKPMPAALEKILQKRSVRTISGVSPIGILTKPYPCPGKCVYCPTEDRMPKSYMSNQPAAARAVRNNFHPYDQVKNRIIALQESGHPTSKLEVIVMGGTWSFLPHKYQSWYIKKCFDAANGDDRNHPKAKTLAEAQKINETANCRIIGLTLETRPDFITERELIRMRKYGCTRVEIGVQTLDDEVQKLTKRGHMKKHVVRAMQLMKDYGFKICWHLMPGLPGSNPEKDLAWMEEVFTDTECRPDFIKIYPCVVLETAELKEWWKDGRYVPYHDDDIVKILIQWMVMVPEYVRIMRLMRDIPVTNILDGAKFSNLRQILTDQPKKLKEIVGEEFYEKHKMAETGWQCRDIRTREVGFAKEIPGEPGLVRRDYEANGGTEVFLSFEDPKQEHLFALLRLRKPTDREYATMTKALKGAALIREVHSYGTEISIGDVAGIAQHRGLGKALIAEAERIAKEEWGCKKITVIAGVGTKQYYAKWGYEDCQTYMTKKI